MLRRLRITPVVMSVAAGTAFAQTPEGSLPAVPPAPQAAPAPDSAQATPQPPPAADGVQGQVDANGVYTVKSGDTLWDLSGQFLNNPWYWPKIWADNPGVENPHWIYPGNRLKIRQDGDGAGGQVSQQTPESDTAQTDPELPPQPPELPDVSKGTLTPDALATQGAGIDASDLNPYKLPSFLRVRVQTIITERELAETGVITNSFEQKEMLTSYDKVYISFNKLDDVKIGSTYSIFRTGDQVIHPITKRQFGYQTELIGSLKITGKSGKLAVGEIGSVTSDVERGDHITLAASLEKTVQRIPNTSAVQGVILATEVPKLTEIGEDHVVFIDKGSKDGVQDGNTFQVLQSGDGLDHVLLGREIRKRASTLPSEAVGTLMVFNVREHSAAAMVMKSIREIKVGDVVAMQPQVAQQGGAGDAP